MQFKRKVKIFIIAGELSGDQIGSSIIYELKKRINVTLFGVGGKNLMKLGLKPIFPIKNIALMGILEIVPKIPKLLSLINLTFNSIKSINPDLIITIDSPDFNFRIGKKLKKHNINTNILHIVAPSVWAWKAGRAKKISKFIDYLFVLYSFEKIYFTMHGIKTHFIGHPIMEQKNYQSFSENYKKKILFKNDKRIISIFPGSRKKEIIIHLNKILLSIKELKQKNNFNIAIVAVDEYLNLINSIVFNFKNTLSIKVFKTIDKLKVFKESYAAVAVSGTITLELAIHKVPFFTVYKLNFISYLIVKNLVKIKYITLLNIIFGKKIINELIQKEFNINNIIDNLDLILENKKHISIQNKYFDKLNNKLLNNKQKPSFLAAKIIQNII